MRTIAGVGPTEIAHGKFASDQLSGRLEVGRRNSFGRFAVTPFAAAEFAQLWQRDYSESSTLAGTDTPGILGLTYTSQSVTSLPISFGLQAESRYALANGMVWSPFARIAWVHEMEPERQVVPTFNVAPGFSFASTGAEAASDLARMNFGFDLSVAPHASFFTSLSSELSSSSRSYSIAGGYRVGW